MKIHAIQAGRLKGNETTLKSSHWSSILRRRKPYEFPAYVYIIERPGGHIVIDTGMNSEAKHIPLPLRRFVPFPAIRSREEEIGPQMNARGLRPEEVRTVILTHLDFDHTGGVGWFRNAEVIVHRPEFESVRTFTGRRRCQPELWPPSFDPVLYDMEGDSYGPFPRSKSIDDGILHLVPLPGHSLGQVGVILEIDRMALFFTADHFLRQDWFIAKWAAGRVFGVDFPACLPETTRRIRSFIEEMPTVLLPAHDSEAPRRLAAMEPVPV